MAFKKSKGKNDAILRTPMISSSIADIMKGINNKFGLNAVQLAKDLVTTADFRVSTGSVSVDIALGGGIPFGRMINFAGNYSSCKSALGYHVIANMQKKYAKKKIEHPMYPDGLWIPCLASEGDAPLVCSLIQSESHTYSNSWAQNVGLDINSLLFVSPGSMEEAIHISQELQGSAGIDLIMHDSYTALSPSKVLEAGIDGSYQMGIKAQALTNFHNNYQMTNNRLSRSGKIPTILLAITQLKDKISLYGGQFIPGGKSIGFTEAAELRMRKGDAINVGSKDNPQFIGQTIEFKIEKSKISKPYMTGSFDFYFEDEGGPVMAGQIDTAKELIIEAINYGIIEGSGWYSYNGNRLGQGKDNVIKMLRSDTKLFNDIREKVINYAVTKHAKEEEEEKLEKEETDNIEKSKPKKSSIKRARK